MNDKTILDHITELVDEEHRLRAAGDASGDAAERMRTLAHQLDQCWDLLRQRRARREFGQNPDDAQLRDTGTVEGYLG